MATTRRDFLKTGCAIAFSALAWKTVGAEPVTEPAPVTDVLPGIDWSQIGQLPTSPHGFTLYDIASIVASVDGVAKYSIEESDLEMGVATVAVCPARVIEDVQSAIDLHCPMCCDIRVVELPIDGWSGRLADLV